ncbi:ABC transporter permease [Paenibacillus flagellatus]|uniref:Polysaccharide ABC transporter ATP-binding protein n=1 Tax=Paenibacillus flagellatus TaxID=2211139 RepID=A0A2V5KV56_9BACL|nr:ABC transporter permease subunit [Paenibacillus flagellatus]PYI55957.1 polysaccharide ABC transporter ATP-binding protein [Paenibacillus flagellatus]
MLLPGLLWLIVYKYVPMYGAVIAFKDFRVSEGILGSPWAQPWNKHFLFFFHSPYFTQLLGNTLIISFYKLVFGIVPPIAMALLLHECRFVPIRRFVQTLSYMPHFLSWVIVYGILIALLSQTTGLVNRWLTGSGHAAIPFLQSPDWFRTILVGSEIWQDLGWGAVIYLAAIAGIDPSLYEAARVDGAGRLRTMWSVTLPGIRNVVFLLLILRLGRFLDAGFEQIYIMYNIHVYPVADIIDTWVFRTGLEQMNFSLAAAVGLFKSAIGLLLVLGSNRLAKRWGGQIW